jgi:quercetin dioxygenase-like cupin family protein
MEESRTLPSGLVALRFDQPEAPDPASVARQLRSEGVEPYAWSNGPGDRYPVHSHDYTKLLMCATGSITFLVGRSAAERQAVELRPGEGFVLPPGTPHAAIVGPEGCTCLEGHRRDR